MADLEWEDGPRSWPRRARSCKRQMARLAERGWIAARRAPSSSSWSSATPTRRRGRRAIATSTRPTSTTSTTRCSAPSRVEPLIRRIRNSMMGAGMQVENSKGECNFGQHEINFLYGPVLADRRRPHDLQERRQGDRRPGGHVAHVTWPSSTSSRATRATSTSRSSREDGSPLFADEPETLRPLPRRPAGLHARADAALRAPDQLVQALRRGLVRADRRGVGARQPHLRAAGRRPRRGPAGRVAPAGRRRQPVPGDRAR